MERTEECKPHTTNLFSRWSGRLNDLLCPRDVLIDTLGRTMPGATEEDQTKRGSQVSIKGMCAGGDFGKAWLQGFDGKRSAEKF